MYPSSSRSRQTLPIVSLLLVLPPLLLGGCAGMAMNPLLERLDQSFQYQDDLELIRRGAPAHLLVIDGLITSDPDNRRLLLTGTRAYVSYTALLSALGEEKRAGEISRRAREYGAALLALLPGYQTAAKKNLPEFTGYLRSLTARDLPVLFWGGYGLAAWIQQQAGSPAAMAELPRVERIMLRVVELDETFYYGSAHIFLGAYYCSRPPLLGGDPEAGRLHFERALAVGERRFLPAQVAYAGTYARNRYDRQLFHDLLTEVLARKPEKDHLAAANQLARLQARRLLEKEDEYF